MPANLRIDFDDLGTSSPGFMIVGRIPEGIAIGFGVEVDGDLDLCVSVADAQRLVDALSQVVASSD